MSSLTSAKKRRKTLYNYIQGDNSNRNFNFIKNCYKANKSNWMFDSDERFVDSKAGMKIIGINKNNHKFKGEG